MKPLFDKEATSPSSVSARPLFADPPSAAEEVVIKRSVTQVFEGQSSRLQVSEARQQAFRESFERLYQALNPSANKALNLACELILEPRKIAEFGESLLTMYRDYSREAGELALRIDQRRVGETLNEITEAILESTKKPFLWFRKPRDFDLDRAKTDVEGLMRFLRAMERQPQRMQQSIHIAKDDLALYFAILDTLRHRHAELFDDARNVSARIEHRQRLLSDAIDGFERLLVIMESKAENIIRWIEEMERLLKSTFPTMELNRSRPPR